MDEFTHEQGPHSSEAGFALREPGPPPMVSEAEREFWRRAVAAERARQCCGRPAPFPFQES